MEQDEFINICQNSKYQSKDNSEEYSLSREIFAALDKHGDRQFEKLPVIWLETNDSGDNNISFMNTTYPYLDKVLDNLIDLYYSNTFMAAQGDRAKHILNETVNRKAGQYTLVVEGAIPTKADGAYNVVFITDERPVTALEAVKWLGEKARYVVAIGTCASFGGPSAASPNLTGCVGVNEILDREVINVSGCPVNPDWFVGTLAHLLLFGMPELDVLGRPVIFYEFTVHKHCQRRSYFDQDVFADELGEKECMFKQGCTGPKTGADCPYRLWVNHVSYPIKANTPCIGCTNADFPDGSSPFFVPLPEKRKWWERINGIRRKEKGGGEIDE